MLFNASQDGSEELSEITGFFYALNDFANIKTDITLAEEDMASLIGPVFDVADEYYNTAQETPSPFMERFLEVLRLPIALKAIHSFIQTADVSHEDSGRKVKIDAEREKLPWEWMLAKDDAALNKKINKTTDRLIAFLDTNIDNAILAPWKASPQRKLLNSLFITTTKDFNDIFPIDNSRAFFLRIAPFIREAERKYIQPVLTKTVFDNLKIILSTPGESIDPPELLPLIQVPLALFSISIALDRLAIEFLPSGIFQNSTSAFQTMNVKSAPGTDPIRAFAASNLITANSELRILQDYLSQQNEEEIFVPRDLTKGLNEESKHARL